MKNIAVLLTVHNRKEHTLNCLSKLEIVDIPNQYGLDIYLVDDASTDGTSKAVEINYPNVKIINGNGSLYWNRGMHLAWKTACSANKKYDYYLWLNDDTYLFKQSLRTLLEISNAKENKSIVVGALRSSESNITTYGARENKVIQVNGKIQQCTTFNGNCVLIPDYVYQKLGILDPFFRHAYGDTEYGLRAKRYGINSYVTPDHIGICDNNKIPKDCFSKTIPFRRRIRHFYSPLGMNPIEYFYLNNKYYGLYKAVRYFITKHFRVFFPKNP